MRTGTRTVVIYVYDYGPYASYDSAEEEMAVKLKMQRYMALTLKAEVEDAYDDVG